MCFRRCCVQSALKRTGKDHIMMLTPWFAQHDCNTYSYSYIAVALLWLKEVGLPWIPFCSLRRRSFCLSLMQVPFLNVYKLAALSCGSMFHERCQAWQGPRGADAPFRSLAVGVKVICFKNLQDLHLFLSIFIRCIQMSDILILKAALFFGSMALRCSAFVIPFNFLGRHSPHWLRWCYPTLALSTRWYA